MNKPIEYSEEIAAEICERMIEGKGLLQICKDDDMPARGTVYRWLDGRQSFRDRYARAREAQMDYFAELIREIAFDESGDIVIEQEGGKSKAVANHAKVQRDRLKVDSLKWIASKLFGRQYGDKPAEVPQTPGTISVSWQKTDSAQRIERIIIDPAYPRFDADGNLLKPGTPEYDAAGPSEREKAFRNGSQDTPQGPAEPPRQIAYNPTPPPADLTPEAWAAIARVSELIEQIAPSDEKPEHVFGIIEGALRRHYLGMAEPSSAETIGKDEIISPGVY